MGVLKFIYPSPAQVRTRSADEIWHEIEAALSDPEMIDEGDERPCEEVITSLKRIIDETKSDTPIPPPHVDLFDGTIRLTWTRPDRNIRLVVARAQQQSYLYHEEVRNGRGVREGIVAATAENLTYWLRALATHDFVTAH